MSKSSVMDNGVVFSTESASIYGQYNLTVRNENGDVVDSVTAPMNTITQGFRALMTFAVMGEANKIMFGGDEVPANDPITGGNRVEFTSHGLSNQMPYIDAANGTRDIKSLGIYFDAHTTENYRHDRMSNLPFRSTSPLSAGEGTVSDGIRGSVNHFNNTEISTSFGNHGGLTGNVFRVTKKFRNQSSQSITPINLYLMARGGANAYMSTNEGEAGRRRHNNHLIVAMEHLQGTNSVPVPAGHDFEITFTFLMDGLFHNARRYMTLCLGADDAYTRTTPLAAGWLTHSGATINTEMPIETLLGGVNITSNQQLSASVRIGGNSTPIDRNNNFEVIQPQTITDGETLLEYLDWEQQTERYRARLSCTLSNTAATTYTIREIGIYSTRMSPSHRVPALTYRELVTPAVVLAAGESVDVQITIEFYCKHGDGVVDS